MTRDATGGEPAAAMGHPPHPTGATSRDWFVVEVYEWMWRDDGLGLRPGAERSNKMPPTEPDIVSFASPLHIRIRR